MQKEANMKKATKLVVKKVTLRDLDDPTLDSIAGGTTGNTCEGKTCSTCNIMCKETRASCDGTCFGTICI